MAVTFHFPKFLNVLKGHAKDGLLVFIFLAEYRYEVVSLLSEKCISCSSLFIFHSTVMLNLPKMKVVHDIGGKMF